MTQTPDTLWIFANTASDDILEDVCNIIVGGENPSGASRDSMLSNIHSALSEFSQSDVQTIIEILQKRKLWN